MDGAQCIILYLHGKSLICSNTLDRLLSDVSISQEWNVYNKSAFVCLKFCILVIKSENSCDLENGKWSGSEVENGGGSNEMCDVYYRMRRCAARK